MLSKMIDSLYEANFIELYDKSFIDELLNRSVFTYLDYKSRVNGSNYYGKLEINSMNVKVKWVKEVVCKNHSNYAFFTVKVDKRNRDMFLFILKNLKHHMYMENDKTYFDIMNKYLIHKWLNGDFNEDPTSENKDRINVSLRSCGIITQNLIQ